MYASLSGSKPEDTHYQKQMAATYLQKMRETMDPEYLNRAAKIVDAVLSADRINYEALRLRSAIELERHDFPRAAQNSRELVRMAPEDPWNYGTLGDSLMELGEYSAAADAYQKMVQLRPDMASYNRAAYYRFVAGDPNGAIEIMKMADRLGQPLAGKRGMVPGGSGQYGVEDRPHARSRPRPSRARSSSSRDTIRLMRGWVSSARRPARSIWQSITT